MKVAAIVATLAYATMGFAAAAQPRACPQDQCPAKCKSYNMESDCWGARALCICVDSAGKEWSTNIG
ncbi:hypothetical protein BKA56DRAFT_681538 [Ilyonectria sp. MPI-CAGE-AT-0026]|nr:hypothetical protein BKA56DRAFT_681538 [Ilyonectria sp. MPI-CAGE-AT-0026]